MRRALAVAMVLVAACQSPEPSLSALWARWFSFREIDRITVSPDGERILIGGSDTRDIAAPFGASISQSWTAVLRPDGSVIAEWTPGERTSVGAPQIDDDGWIYGTARASSDPVDIDAFPIPPMTCDIVAVDAAGAIAWEMPWPSADGSCPRELLLAAGMLVLRDGLELTGISTDGTVQWRTALPHFADDGIVREDAVWFVAAPDLDPSPKSRHENIVVRCEPATGELVEVQLEAPLPHVRALEVTASGFFVRRSEKAFPGPWHTAAFDRSGKLRWTSTHSVGHITDPIVAAMATRGGVWQLATDAPSPTPADEMAPIIHRQSIVAEHLDREGHTDARWRRSFAEDPDDAVDNVACPNSDTGPRTVDGSSVQRVIHLGDGALLVAGVQGCRDAFVLALEASR
jgi:hypothetical protein